MTSDDHDEKVRLETEKGRLLYDRLGPIFRDSSPDFKADLEDWIRSDLENAHKINAYMSLAANLNKSQVGIQQGGATAGKAKAERHRRYDQILVDLARPVAAKLNSGQPSYRAVARILKTRVIPRTLREACKAPSPDVDALEHLSHLSENRIHKILLKHKKVCPLAPR